MNGNTPLTLNIMGFPRSGEEGVSVVASGIIPNIEILNSE